MVSRKLNAVHHMSKFPQYLAYPPRTLCYTSQLNTPQTQTQTQTINPTQFGSSACGNKIPRASEQKRRMLSLKYTAASILSLYTTFTATAMLIRGVVTELQAIAAQLIPYHLQTILLSNFTFWRWGNPPSNIMTLYIHDYDTRGGPLNELYEASEIYLATKITTASLNKLKASKSPRNNALALNIDSDDNIDDRFEEMQLHWRVTRVEAKERAYLEKKVIELSFDKMHFDKVVASYLPYVLERSKAIQEENKAVKLYALGSCYSDRDRDWSFTNLDHPSTFDTLAIDPKLKKELIDDLDRFVRRREFYKRVGKAWKRGYLLYGPPGTGKSSLIAAMANYLKFSVYDIELTAIYNNSNLRRYLASTKNRSIVVIEDIDCSLEFDDRLQQAGHHHRRGNGNDSQLTLSGLLNFIDGLYSSCGDERIIVFTTNHKDRLDPALLRPGRMDMHIHMSYCSPSGFRVLASNYLDITSHELFAEIDELMVEVEVTPAQVAEELMKSEDVDIALAGLVKFLEGKKSESCINDCEKGNEEEECETDAGSERQGGGRSCGNDKKAVKRRNGRRLKIVHR